MIEVADLSVGFRTEEGRVRAVDGVSFEVRPGEVLAVVGESGCGKSVTAMALTGLLPPSASVTGSVRFEGTELVGAPARLLRSLRGRDIAYVFQEPATSLNPVFTVGRQVAEAVRAHAPCTRKAALDRAAELLDLVGVPRPRERLGHYPHQLSGGLRQRVMIAMAVACGPRLIVADEPTTALDVTIQAAILDLLRDLRSRLGTAVLLITHDLGVVADSADRVVVMYAGRVAESGTARAIFTRPLHPYTRGLMGAVPAGAGRRLTEIPGMVPVLADSPDVCTFANRCPLAVPGCLAGRPPLRSEGSDTSHSSDDSHASHGSHTSHTSHTSHGSRHEVACIRAEI
ncbi:ABC transporter ATP-binding protein [Nonomuraea sp. NPDC050790]|uniref:ABC transporter ATP-binding protein n=1 Tax=Nonomuraea sp. NPDC050790 TaxID=3364371 RepID=UPI0037AC222F